MHSENRPGLTAVRLFCSDLDGTLLGNPEASRRFKQAWESLPAASRPFLVYSTGRFVQDVIDLLATQILPWPEYIIGGVGTQMYDGRQKRSLHAHSQPFRDGWRLDVIEQVLSNARWADSAATEVPIEQLLKLLAKHTSAGELGVKSKRGFYDYSQS